MKKPFLFIIRGLPGSGKSTYSNNLLKKGEIDFFFEADQWMIGNNGEYQFNPKKLAYCHNKCQEYTRKALEKGNNVAVSNTFTTIKELQPYLDMADIADISVIRLAKNFGSIHSVPTKTIQMMRDRFEDFKGEYIPENY